MAEQLNPAVRVNRVVPGSAQATIARLGAGTFGPGAQVMADYLFDTVTLATGAQSLDFFSVPLGGAKTVADTNLTLPGQLPRGQAFEIHYVNCRLLRGSVVASTAAQAAFADLLAGSFWRHFFPGSDFWLRHSGAEVCATGGKCDHGRDHRRGQQRGRAALTRLRVRAPRPLRRTP